MSGLWIYTLDFVVKLPEWFHTSTSAVLVEGSGPCCDAAGCILLLVYGVGWLKPGHVPGGAIGHASAAGRKRPLNSPTTEFSSLHQLT